MQAFKVGSTVYIDPAIKSIHRASIIAGKWLVVVEQGDCPPGKVPVRHEDDIWYAEQEYVRESKQ